MVKSYDSVSFNFSKNSMVLEQYFGADEDNVKQEKNRFISKKERIADINEEIKALTPNPNEQGKSIIKQRVAELEEEKRKLEDKEEKH